MVIGQRESLAALKDADAGIEVIVAAARLQVGVNLAWAVGPQGASASMFWVVLSLVHATVPGCVVGP